VTKLGDFLQRTVFENFRINSADFFAAFLNGKKLRIDIDNKKGWAAYVHMCILGGGFSHTHLVTLKMFH
jgi:hypothetical protein